MTDSRGESDLATSRCGLPARLFLIGLKEVAGESAATRLIAELDEAGVSIDDYLERLIGAWSAAAIGGSQHEV